MLLSEPRPTRWDLHWRMFGAEVRIRPIFWASCVLLGSLFYRDPHLPIAGMTRFWFWLAAVLISLLVHETCHILAARLFGARVRVVLSAMGGTVYGLDELKRWPRVFVLWAGPLGNGLLAGILWIIADPQWNPLPIERLGQQGTIFLVNAVAIAYLFNAYWALLNLLPLWPLDGGRVAVEIGEAILGRRGQTPALLLSLVVCLWLSLTVVHWARGNLFIGNLLNRFDPAFPLYLFYFCVLALYCYVLWLSTFRALWGDPVPLDEPGKSGRAA
jgi:stage IV sporulation protein FB